MSIKTALYVSLSLVVGCTSASAQAPSFNCSKATYPDERAICSNAELSQLDNVANAGYEYVRRIYGNQYAKSVTLPPLQARRACAADVACIRQQQLVAIQKFQSLGAPVNVPQTTQPMPAQFQSPSFDCTKARAKVEHIICGDAELAQLDNSLAHVFNLRYPQLNDDQRRALLEDEGRWIRARNGQCDVAAFNLPAKPCILQMMKARIAALTAAGGAATPSSIGGASVLPQPRQQTTATPFVVTIETLVTGGARPVVTGTTNLPDGTQLSMYLRKPWLPNGRERLAVGLAACGDDCIPLTAQHGGGGVDPVVVKNGQFSDGPFTDKGAALRPGRYVLEIWIFGATNDEPPDVLAIIGSRGENMLGPLVGACCFAFIGTQAELQKERDDAPERALHLGASIYYARYVEIGPPVPNSLSQSYQPQPQPLRTPNAVQDQSRSPVTTAFTECLLSQGRNGSYTSFDGGMSAIRLMGVACKAQWDAWQDECIAQGGTDGGPGGCTMQAGIMAQAALKMLGK